MYTRTFVIFVATLACSMSIVYVSKNLPFSLIFNYLNSNNLQQIVEDSNQNRINKAMEYLKSMKNKRPVVANYVSSDVLILIVTVTRSGNNHYLTQTVAAMDSAIRRSRGDREYGLLICNADSRPGKHKEALELRDFGLYVDKEHTSNITGHPPQVPRAINSGLKDAARIQEISDYVFCLNASMALKYKHVLVLEDDVLPINNLLPTLELIILRKLRYSADDSAYYGMTKPFLYLKLYYPQRWQGFAYETGIMLEFLGIGVVVGGIIVCLDTLCGSRNRRKGHTIFIFMLYTALALCWAKCLGRVNINEVRRLSPQLYRFGRSAACCTQAMLYPRGAIYPLMEHLLVNNSLNKDLSIHRFSEISGYPGYHVEPNLFQHIGMHTSLSGGSDKNPEEFLFKLHESTFK